jgi:hypothetical protein
MTFYRIQLQKAVVYLTGPEVNSLLMKDPDLFREALGRGKAFSRADSLQARTAQKRG